MCQQQHEKLPSLLAKIREMLTILESCFACYRINHFRHSSDPALLVSDLDQEQHSLISFPRPLLGPGENTQHQQKQTSDSVVEHRCDVKPGVTGSHYWPVATNFTAWAACFVQSA